MPGAILLTLALVGLGLGLGLKFLKMIPRQVVAIIGIVAAVTIIVMFWNLLGLPAVALANQLIAIEWLFGLSLGYLAGQSLGNLLP